MPADDKNRERSPANLNIKYNPTLGASNAKRFQASVRTLLKTSAQNGELALAVLEGSADSSKESLVLFEPRALPGGAGWWGDGRGNGKLASKTELGKRRRL